MSGGPIEGRHYVHLVVPLSDCRTDARIAAALILLYLFPLFWIEVVRVRIQSVKHSQDRGFCSLVQIDLSCVVVLCNEHCFCEIISNPLSSNRIVVAIAQTLCRMGACKCNRDNQGQD